MLERSALRAMHEERGMLVYHCDGVPVQVGLAGDPWKVIVACQLLNKTHISQARPALRTLLGVYPGPEQMYSAAYAVLEALLHPLGFGTKRSTTLLKLAREWLVGGWEEAWELPGVGQYAEDALKIFCCGDWSFEPEDKILKSFVRAANLRMQDQPGS